MKNKSPEPAFQVKNRRPNLPSRFPAFEQRMVKTNFTAVFDHF
jgi:hypothetical protein